MITSGHLSETSHPEEGRSTPIAEVGFAALLVICVALSVVGLVLGLVLALAPTVPLIADALVAVQRADTGWGRALLTSAASIEDSAQLVLDYAFSMVALALAARLLAHRQPMWTNRLLALAMIGSASAFNLQVQAAVGVVADAGLAAARPIFLIGLPVIVCMALLLALTTFAAVACGGVEDRWSRTVPLTVAAASLPLIGMAAALLPMAYCCAVLLGVLVPVAGSSVLLGQTRRITLIMVRSRSRQMFTVLAGAFAVTIVLTIVTVVLVQLQWTGQDLADPTANSSTRPIALLFWFARVVNLAIPIAWLVIIGRGGPFAVEHLFSRGLVATAVAAAVAGGYIMLHAVGENWFPDELTFAEAMALSALAGMPVALVFPSLYVRVEQVVDRVLYGARPAPYSVLAGIAALSRSARPGGLDLTRVAEAIGQGLGASVCTLAVAQPGAHDRMYRWAEPGVGVRPVIEVPVRYGAERIGAVAVDEDAAAATLGQRQHLLEDVADSLGAVFQAHRIGIALEYQLRAAEASADRIAAARRATVAEMDAERQRLERDLHDGAQHHLVSLQLTIGLVEHDIAMGQLSHARTRLALITQQIAEVAEVLAETATGVSAPKLNKLGLVRALRLELGAAQPPITLDCRGVDEQLPIPPAAQTAVYFCCLEAVNNARKHAAGAPIGVWLMATPDRHLRFVVRDGGPGWDTTAATSAGRGLRNMMSRAATVGGWLDVRSAPGWGTTVEGAVPLDPPAQTHYSAIPSPGPRRPASIDEKQTEETRHRSDGR